MASKTRAVTARMSARLRKEIAARQAQDPEIEVVLEPEVAARPTSPLPVSPQENGGDREGVPRGRATQARRSTASRARASPVNPPVAPTPNDTPVVNSTWLLKAMQDAGIPVQELLEQGRLMEEFRQLRDRMTAEEQSPMATPPPAASPAPTASQPQGAPITYLMHPDASGFKPQPDFTGHDQDLDAYARKFKARMDAMRVPLEDYSRMFIAQLDKAALNFAISNNLTAEMPFEELMTVMRTGPWVREITDLSGRRRLSSGSLQRKPVHEIVKTVDDMFAKLPSSPCPADRIHYLMTNLPQAVQDKAELTPAGTAWLDYGAFRTFVLQLGAISKPPATHFRTPEFDKRRASNSGLPGVGPLRFVSKPSRDVSPFRHNARPAFGNTFKRAKKSNAPFARNNADPSGWRRVGPPPKRCVACGQTGHQARDTRDGKTPVCKKYDPKKGALIKVHSKNMTSQR